MEPNKVYMIVIGHYEDETTVAATFNPTLANSWVEEYKSKQDIEYLDEIRIVEQDVYLPEISPIIAVYIDKDGKLAQIKKVANIGNEEIIGFQFFEDFEFEGLDLAKFNPPFMRWDVATDDIAYAINVANEKRKKIVSKGLWGEDDAEKIEYLIERGLI